MFLIQLINTLVCISPAGFEILAAGKAALWIRQVSDELRAAAYLFPSVSSSNTVDSGEPDYVFTRLSIPDFIYLRIFVRQNQATIHLTAKIYPCVKSGRVFWASRLAGIHKYP